MPDTFKEIQRAFANNIRAPQQHATPAGVAERRMAVYRELFYNNIEGMIASAFPVLHAITDHQRWHGMIRDFFARHECRTPFFHEIAKEFLHYLAVERPDDAIDPPFFNELAHYEWLELTLSLDSRDARSITIDSTEITLDRAVVLSPLVTAAHYHYPVHRIRPDFTPDQPMDSFLVVYRDSDDSVRFMETNALAHALLTQLQQHPDITCRAILANMATRAGVDLRAVESGGLDTLQRWQQRGIILGSRHPMEQEHTA